MIQEAAAYLFGNNIFGEKCLQNCKLGLLLYEKSLILYLMIEQIGGASYGSRSKNSIFTRRTGETGNT